MTIKSLHIIRLLAAMTLVVIVALGAMAQSDAAFSHYWVGKGYYNPATAGEINAIHMNVGSRMQWVDFRHAPMNFYVTVDAPFKLLGQRVGLGVKAEYERIGLYSNTRIGGQIAYKRKLGRNMLLSVGVQPGVFSQTFRGSEKRTPTDTESSGVGDDYPDGDVSGTVFDANVGVFFSHPRFWAGVAVTHATAPSIELKVSAHTEAAVSWEFNVARGYNFMAGGNIPINNTLFEIQPSGMFFMTDKVWTAHVATMVRYNRMFNIGAGYRWKDAVTAYIGVNLKDAYIGYAYDYPVSAISKATFGSHEVFVTYNVKLDDKKKNKNKQKSVRLM